MGLGGSRVQRRLCGGGEGGVRASQGWRGKEVGSRGSCVEGGGKGEYQGWGREEVGSRGGCAEGGSQGFPGMGQEGSEIQRRL